MSTYRFDAVVFDFDGVLVESVDVKTQAFAQLYREYGSEIEAKVVDYHLKNGGVSRFLKFRHFHEVFLGKPLSTTEEKELGDRFSRLVVDTIVASPWVMGAKEFLEDHHSRLKLFVASGTPDGELAEIVERRGMRQYFVSTHGTPRKKGEIIADLINRNGFSPKRVLMVGDALADLEGALQAGTVFLGRETENASVFPKGTPMIPDLRSLTHFVQVSSNSVG